MSDPRPIKITELINRLIRLRDAYGDVAVWLDIDTDGWVVRAEHDDDGDVTLYGQSDREQ